MDKGIQPLTGLRQCQPNYAASVVLWLAIALVLLPSSVSAFPSILPTQKHVAYTNCFGSRATRCRRLPMVRNIDLPEGLILYGTEVIGSPVPRTGLVNLLRECQDIDTATILLHEKGTKPLSFSHDVTDMCSHFVEQQQHATGGVVTTTTGDLLHILATVEVQPRPFGGSSGFGSQPAEPPRPLLAERCVVLAGNLAATRAARATGMRVISVDIDDPLADAVLLDPDGAIDFGVDDIATPGSFWLNPPHPRDDEGNRVDPYEMQANVEEPEEGRHDDDPPMDEDDISAILSDMAPLS